MIKIVMTFAKKQKKQNTKNNQNLKPTLSNISI